MENFNLQLRIESPARITKLLFGITECFTNSHIQIKSSFNELNENLDTRLLVFTYLREVANNTLLSSIFLKDHLMKKSWWADNKNFDISADQLNEFAQDRIHHYGLDMSTSYLILSFSQLEISLRSIIKNICDVDCPNSAGEFYKIRNYLIEKGNLNPEYKTLLQIFQNIRNSMHYAGFHNKENVNLAFKNLSIEFIKDSPIIFDVWETIDIISKEISNLLIDLSNSELIRNIPRIIHPFATVRFIPPIEKMII